MKVLMPAKAGWWPRLNREMLRSMIEFGGFEAELQRSPDILVLLLLRDARQLLHRSGAIRVLAPDAVRMTVAVRMAVFVWMAVIAAFFSSRHVQLLAL